MKKTLLLTLFLFITTFARSQVLSPVVDSIATSDGKKLAADIYLPDTSGGQTFPTILVQTPYNRLWYRFGLPLIGTEIDTSPFAFVILDWRCFYGSAAACVTTPDRGADGYDAVEWIASQSWSDGQVATWGPSALGRVQYMTAKKNPPHLVCAVPLVAGPQYSYQEYFPGGVARDEYIDQLDGLGFGMSGILYANPHYNLLWSYSEATNFYPDSIQIPLLMIGGWFDHNSVVMLDFFDAVRTSSPATVRDKHKLLMGPWVHGGHGAAYVGTDSAGQLSYPMAAGMSDSLAMRFLKYYLLSEVNGYDTLSTIINFQMGVNNWQYIENWPQNGFTETNLYLHENMSLLNFLPTGVNEYKQITYDPRDPSPTVGGPTLRADLVQGPYDQVPVVESRGDILVFTSPVLETDATVQGYPKVILQIKSDCKDVDFAARLTDVYPDGRSMLLVDGIRRARFRQGYTTNDTTFISDSTAVYQIEIELNPTSHTFLAGHRIRLDITSSNYPRFNNNMNDGGPMYVAGDTTVAHNRVLCNGISPSMLILPVDIIDVGVEKSIIPELSVYPNPCSNELFITIPNEIKYRTLTVLIIDASGKKISAKPGFTGNVVKINTASLAVGLYTIQLQCDVHSFAVTFFKK
ncbi:MAG: hypothetical protein A2W93_03240 [Bacteroidetes bacterium GWF2_43_63]|nr:MAG: hypothetical protein A2W94_09240 [Bacteroidetes bacterium GWE2_42_42]OFY53675.1 MAG: hypothetical protein A2W93_03240 [Bacteroidetes bacterium GWF2_43_63]HBG70980.1 hypothetical protein [Bacteroidales bacterium]HCB62929.1 hypothetical protein [Bacteroidales bacterium]HCY24307.1 hypothetical protein [Bacteroidales bacterium]